MECPLKSLTSDGSRYQKSFLHFLECANANQHMKEFIDNLLPDKLARIVNGKSHLNVIGVGSGSGELDLKIFSMLHLMNPQMTVDNEVVEPNPQQLHEYRDLVSQTPGLDHIQFNWNNMTAEEFEEQWKEKKRTKKADFIHMIQMLYYVKDVGATISFYHSLLNKNGNLLIALASGESGSAKLWQTYGNQLCNTEINTVSVDDIKSYLDSKELTYQSYEMQNQVDITECFTEGDENGELLLDFLTNVHHFSKAASPELKAGILEFIRHPDHSVESHGKVMLNDKVEVIVVDQLS